MAELDPRALSVTKFWRDAGEDAWFEKSDSFDTDFRTRFLELHYAAARRECDDWNTHAEGSLALMILLDQFPRNCFRGTGHMYATDPLARFFARMAVKAGHHQAVEPELAWFFVLPFLHSESLEDQEFGVELARPFGEEMMKHATGHRDIVLRFGRFPHRNPMLGRVSTPDEQAFLDGGGFAG